MEAAILLKSFNQSKQFFELQMAACDGCCHFRSIQLQNNRTPPRCAVELGPGVHLLTAVPVRCVRCVCVARYQCYLDGHLPGICLSELVKVYPLKFHKYARVFCISLMWTGVLALLDI